jgi:hypothetical protein
MAHISVPAFGTVMICRGPEDADMSGFSFAGFRNRADAQQQLNTYLEGLGYDVSQSYLW